MDSSLLMWSVDVFQCVGRADRQLQPLLGVQLGRAQLTGDQREPLRPGGKTTCSLLALYSELSSLSLLVSLPAHASVLPSLAVKRVVVLVFGYYGFKLRRLQYLLFFVIMQSN